MSGLSSRDWYTLPSGRVRNSLLDRDRARDMNMKARAERSRKMLQSKFVCQKYRDAPTWACMDCKIPIKERECYQNLEWMKKNGYVKKCPKCGEEHKATTSFFCYSCKQYYIEMPESYWKRIEKDISVIERENHKVLVNEVLKLDKEIEIARNNFWNLEQKRRDYKEKYGSIFCCKCDKTTEIGHIYCSLCEQKLLEEKKDETKN
jgi:uncharacterized protein (UPF0212 family)